ncbi:MAG: chloride channel protein, partial [Proteobacteria bacterium]|nr:chloride channel protein [Pseudomonadota bacterium]
DRRMLVLAAMALVVGAGGAAAAMMLLKLITLVTNAVWFGRLDFVTRSLSQVAPSLWMVIAPALGGLVIGLMARFGSEKIRGHGIPEAIEAILIGGSRMSPRVAVLKPLSSAISIGSGGPFGAEGPIIMTGGAFGSLFAQMFHLSAAERKTLLVAGAAAGMTAVFGSPVAAVLLAVELLLFEWRPRSFVPTVVAVVIAASLRPLLIGAGPLFPFAAPALDLWWLLPACIAFGALIGLQSSGITKALYIIEDAFERLPIHWMWWPMLGGLVVGLGGLLEPRVLGVGYDVIGALLASPMTVRVVLALLLVKSVVWLVALSSGTSGGVLAPLLTLGGALGWIIGLILPGGPAVWALMGMAAMLGGVMRAPLTGAVFAVEITGQTHLLAPLLAAAVGAFAVTVLIMKRSILTEKIARRGHHIFREYSVDPYQITRVADVMVRDVEVLSADLSVADAIAVLEAGRHRIYPVVDAEARPVGLVSRGDALRWKMETGASEERLEERISDASVIVTHPDVVLAAAVDLMLRNDLGRIPVIDRQSGRLTGLLTRKDLLQVHARTSRSERERTAYLIRGA